MVLGYEESAKLTGIEPRFYLTEGAWNALDEPDTVTLPRQLAP